ncbi:MAG: hypothetical protein ACTHKT_14520 [Solirubrobacterales bacterium]
MHKKLMMACMAIAAFAAFVIAPAASASPVLTEGTTAVAVGSSIEGKNTGNTEFTGGFNVVCSTAVLKGTVTGNSGTKIKGEVPAGSAVFTGTSTGGDCTSALGATKVTVNSKLCLETAAEDKVAVTGCGANVTFTLEVTGTGPCKYSTASVTGTYKTSAAATVNVENQAAKKEEGGVFCPSEGVLKMDFDLYTTGGSTALTIS